MPRTIQEILDHADELAERAAGASRQKIGGLLGTSAQAAQQRYGSVVESV